MNSNYFYDITEERDVLRYISKLDEDILIIYSPTFLKKIYLDNIRINMINWHDISKDIEKIENYIKKLKNVKEIISLGGGSTIDIGKYISYRLNIKYTCIPTMLSTNSYATNKVALMEKGKKITIETKMPEKIIIDNKILKLSKNENIYGLADVFSIYTALYDWKISNIDTNESINLEIYKNAEILLSNVIKFIKENSLETIINSNIELFKFIGIAGYITNLYGTGRPESGSEHIMAKEIERKINIPHGISVSIGILIMTLLQERDLSEMLYCMKKIKIFKNINDFGITKEFIKQCFMNLEPRDDRYTVINRYVNKNNYKENIINSFFEILDKELEIC